MGYTAVGEHVGLAQRMESVAPPGGVMLSETTARLVQHAAVLGEPEAVRIKGFDNPVPACRLLGMEKAHTVVGRGEPRLVGRRWEIAAVEAILERSIEGDGTALALVGPAGIGKSRLVREIAATAAALDAEVFWAFCESHASDIPFYALGQLLRAAVGLPTLTAESVRNRLRARLVDADEQDLVLFDDLLGIRDPDTPLPIIDPDAHRRRISALVKVALIARTTPAIFVIEDAHWIDDVSDSMLADFMTVIPQTRSMLLLTHRPEFHGALTRVSNAQSLTLAPLSTSESAALATGLLGHDPSVRELASTITSRAAGNPFFAEEIVRDLAERGVLRGQRGAYVCRPDIGEVSVPATLQATIAARIDRLNPSAKHTLCAAAAIGMRFDADLLHSMGVDPLGEELLQAELIDQVEFTGHAEYGFRHPLIRTVAYESQLKSDRAELHRRLADVIASRDESADENAALIAEHLEAAGDVRSAYGWRMRAAETSRGRDIAAALASWDRAGLLADMLPTVDADRFEMRIAPRTLACANGWRISEPIGGKRFEELETLCAAAGDKASIAVATMGLIGETLMQSRLRDVSRLADEHMALIQSIGDPAVMVGISIGPIAAKLMTGEMADVLRWSGMVIDAAEGNRAIGSYLLNSPLGAAYAMRCTARWWLGRTDWRDDFDRALTMARDADPMSQAAIATWTYGNAISCGVIALDDAALQGIDQALHNAERASDDLALGLALYVSASAIWNQGSAQRKRALELCRRVRDMTADGRFYAIMLPVFDLRFAEDRVSRGDRSAVPLLRAGVEELYSSGFVSYCPWATGLLVEALLKGGNDNELNEAAAALERLSAEPVLDGSAFRDLVLLRSKALLARARCDDVPIETSPTATSRWRHRLASNRTSRSPRRWWARTVSNRRPLVCKTRALPLSYAPVAGKATRRRRATRKSVSPMLSAVSASVQTD